MLNIKLGLSLSMKQFLFDLSSNRPKWVFALTLLLTLVSGAFISQIEIDTDPENMLPEQQAERVYHNQIKQRFQLHDAIVVGAVSQQQSIFNPVSLKALVSLTEGISQIEGVIIPDLMSLSSVDNVRQTAKGELRFEWMMKRAPTNQQAAEVISRNIDRLPLLQNTLVSGDDQAAAIYIPIKDKNESYRIATQVEALVSQLDSQDQYHITGLPVAEDTFGFQMFVQMGISAPMAALLIFILMWLFFRNLKFVAAPMMLAMATVITIMGLMIGLGYQVHIMSSMIPIFLMPIAVVDSIHIMSEFADHYKQNSDKRQVIKQVIDNLYKPMLFTSLTSSVGFASLLLTPIPPVQIFGAFVAIGILLAFVLTIVFIPAYLLSLKPESLESIRQINTKATSLQSFLPKFGSFSLAHSKLIISSFILLIIIAVLGVMKIEINDNPVRWFKSEHKIRVADKVLNQHFAGTYDAYIVLELDQSELKKEFTQLINSLDEEYAKLISQQINPTASLGSQINQVAIILDDLLFELDESSEAALRLQSKLKELENIKSEISVFQQPKLLKVIDRIQNQLAQSGLVGKTNSLSDAVKTVYRDLASGRDQDYRIPDTKPGVAQALLQYQSSHRPQDLWHFVTQDYSSTVIWLQMRSGDNQDMSRIIEFVDEQELQQYLPQGISLRWAGKTYLNKVWQDEMVAGMLNSLLGAFVAVFIMMVFLFRSVIFGILAMLPLTITIIGIYGVIGWVGKDYDMPIAVLSALTLGLSVDFAIHFLQRAREIYRVEKNYQATINAMFKEPASAISRNAIVIAIGFTPLLLAPLMPYVTVGFFLAMIMAVSALVTLMLLPLGLKMVLKDKC